MSNSTNESTPYGLQDNSYKAAREEEGLRKLSNDFYLIMDQLPEAKHIRDMHKEDLSLMTDKLTLFLCMWLGGPRTYLEKYGNANMPQAHQHLIINEAERDAWLLCMDKAVEEQDYANDFKEYLKKQFRFPAEMIRKTSKSS
jgi:hemoglobin